MARASEALAKRGNMLPEIFPFPNVSQFCRTGNTVSSSKLCFCLTAETYSRVEKLGNSGKRVSAASVSGNMFPRFARAFKITLGQNVKFFLFFFCRVLCLLAWLKLFYLFL